jgi:zinc transport system permease protein
LSIAPVEIALLAGLLAAVLLLWAALYNRLLLLSINQSLAASRGVNTLASELVFTSVVAVVVTVTIQWVGLLIINSLLVLPAAAARNVSGNTRRYHLFSVAAALVSGVAGLIVSYYAGTAAGATIVLAAAALYFVSFAMRNKVGR